MSKVMDKIVKLFRLGQEGRGGTEAEMLSAVTKARMLMIQHKISERDVHAALHAKGDTTTKVEINEYTAYTRKIKNFARYDEIIAQAVALLTDTSRYVYHMGAFAQMRFIGQPADSVLAAELFMIWLPEVRRITRATWGPDWGKIHTAYAIGFATRLVDRARDAIQTATPTEQQQFALVLAPVTDAIARYKEKLGLTKSTRRPVQVNAFAYNKGYADGDSFNLATKVIR